MQTKGRVASRQNKIGASGFFRKHIFPYWKNRFLFLLFVPVIIHFVVFKYVPMYGVLIAFQKYNIKDPAKSIWIGFENFRKMFAGISFMEVLRNTLVISFYKVVLGFPIPIIFALMLNEIKSAKFKKITQTLSYLPHFVSWVVLAGIFIEFFSPSRGPVNYLINMLTGNTVYFLGDKNYFRFTLVITHIWKTVGWSSIVYVSALSGIDVEQYEAAFVDGASRFKRAIYITLPGLIPVITIMFIFAMGNIIDDDFDQIFNLYSPAVYEVGDVISTYVYRKGIQSMEYGFSTAVGLFKNIIAFILVVSTNMTTRKFSEYGIW